MTVQKLSFGGKFKLIGFSGQTRRRESQRRAQCSYSPHFGIVFSCTCKVGWKFTKVPKSAVFVCFKRILGLDLNIFLYTISKNILALCGFRGGCLRRRLMDTSLSREPPCFRWTIVQTCRRGQREKGVPYPPEAAAAAVAASASTRQPLFYVAGSIYLQFFFLTSQ